MFMPFCEGMEWLWVAWSKAPTYGLFEIGVLLDPAWLDLVQTPDFEWKKV